MVGIDTNVLVRYLVQDDKTQAKKATLFIEKNCTDESPCFIGQIVLAELAWVLEGSYNLSRDEIAHVIEQLLQTGQLEISDREAVWRSLNDYRQSNADFPDHLLARVNESQNCEFTITFDKKASNQSGFTLLK